MSPEQLCARGTESGHQKALFAWANMARLCGFTIADDMNSYGPGLVCMHPLPVTPLRWLHAIPNGGFRDARTAALLKAEGVRPGIPDVFLPYPIQRQFTSQKDPATTLALSRFAGLYIEMKKPKAGVISSEQKEFAEWCREVGYAHSFAYSWRDAADAIKEYLTS